MTKADCGFKLYFDMAIKTSDAFQSQVLQDAEDIFSARKELILVMKKQQKEDGHPTCNIPSLR